MTDSITPPPAAKAVESPAWCVLTRACTAAPGHFDELRGSSTPVADATDSDATGLMAGDLKLTPAWAQFFDTLPDPGPLELNRRWASLGSQLGDNGAAYNVYTGQGGSQRPWPLGLFPLLIEPDSWQQIESGVLQRVRLLEQVMADTYGPQQLLARGLLPPALVQGHPGYLRAMHGVKPVGGNYLHIAAFDLARGPDGHWSVLAQRCQAPSGLGYLLENRRAIAAQFPQAFQALQVQHLTGTYQALVESLRKMSPAGADPHLALLTPGPHNESYFEHTYLARQLGLTLVEGCDLMVRDQRLYLKTIKGLVPVHGLLKRLDDEYLDPLELRADSMLGVPGLLQVIRAGNLLLANAPGAAFLESPALAAFLPALSRHLLDQELKLPALASWWCGERPAMEQALPRLRDSTLQSTYPGPPLHASFDSVPGWSLSAQELGEWAGRISRHGEDYTVQAYAPLSQMPTWQAAAGDSGGQMVARPVMLRVFALSDGAQSWRVLPGGLARLTGAATRSASMQDGGSSADVWALTHGEVDNDALQPPDPTPAGLTQRNGLVTSRAAENLFWLGRYSERTENAVGLARLTLAGLHGEAQSSLPLLTWFGQMALANTLVLPDVPTAAQARPVFERSLISGLANWEGATSVGYDLRALKMTGFKVRERLSQEHWHLLLRAEEELFARGSELATCSSQEALQMLENTRQQMAAIAGAQTVHMPRDDGWHLLSVGRQIERLGFLASSLLSGLQTGAVLTTGGFEAMLALFDSSLAFHAQYRQSRDLAALIDCLVLDHDNPRSLAWVAQTLRALLAELAGSEPGQPGALSRQVPDPATWRLAPLCETRPDSGAVFKEPDHFPTLNGLLLQCAATARQLSDEIGRSYFSLTGEAERSVGTR
ncbi:MAG: circularly permuted type 2 ATP-grasp protein [Rhodoferax sp.]|uniref:circularly permuted type 2 ATP-grasp protein n=1 Tax=Rhodoferax sp. TaxID=50421 RepID=UPI002613CB1A|nr:circularly permuted type 2 ATP-grasp protein [Rhodoferax sp.]MDD5336135.1 circularly permuted type 2 ATP-grasp protein [Rhodoferax sp.]